MQNSNVKRLSEIESKPILRGTTGLAELDYIYGSSTFSDRVLWGMPKGKISLWSGSSGIGKSRMAIEVAKNLCKTNPATKVLYFQTEAELGDFAQWAKDASQYNNFYCSGVTSIREIVTAIYQTQPHYVFIDSINEIEEFASGSKKEARYIINGDHPGHHGLRDVCNQVGCHVVLLGQLNQDKTIKGGTSLPHLVDIALNLTSYDPDSTRLFAVSVGIKHRYGRRGTAGVWMHESWGVRCVSDNRDYDELWSSTHGRAVKTLEQVMMEKQEEVIAPKKKNILFQTIDFLWKST